MLAYVAPAEMELFFYLNGTAGSFSKALFDAIFRADPWNRERLRKGFPEEVEAVKQYMHDEDFWPELIQRMKEL